MAQVAHRAEGESSSLKISFVESLHHIVEPVVQYLNNTAPNHDLFQPDHIIVPNAGVRAWLMQQLSTQLGARPGNTDGVVANINMGYLGTLYSFLSDAPVEADPWSIDHLTMAVLQCINGNVAYVDQVERHGGALLAARAIADTFDTYHAHRPTMIDAWEQGKAELAPELGEHNADDEWLIVRHPLEVRDMWQFTLWQEVRALIGTPSPPAQLHVALQQLALLAPAHAPSKLLIAGLQSVSVRHLQVLRALSQHVPIEMVLVHPSPALAEHHLQNIVPLVPRTDGTLPVRPTTALVPEGIDSLIATWLRASGEVQEILATQGLVPQHLPVAANTPASLLQAVQHAVRYQPLIAATSVPNNGSIQVYRAHNLARQVEILHDALLHEFTSNPTLQPHEIVVLCADMQAAAPLLQAQFDRDVTMSDGTTRRIPLVVADRGLREVSDGAGLLSGLLTAVQSRMSRTDILRLVSLPEILRTVGVSPDALRTWDLFLVRAGLAWGLNDEQRHRQGMSAELAHARTWHSALQQTLLGACLPDQNPTEELGGVVPLTDIDTASLSDISALVHLVAQLSEFEAHTAVAQSINSWCELVESVLVSLCGDSADLLADPMAVLHRVAASSVLSVASGTTTTINIPVSFAEFAAIVSDLVSSVPGRQPLRTGAVTATSFVPLQGVPFKVVCLLGVDDGTLPTGEAEGDDLVARQRFIGDPDSRIDTRRVILDALLAASDTFMVLCNGRSDRNNTPIPYVTPLAELVDMFIRVEGMTEAQQFSAEYQHPRHAVGTRNFAADNGIISGRIWSHDASAQAAAEALRSYAIAPTRSIVPFPVEQTSIVTLDQLHQVLTYPADMFLATIGVSKWENTENIDEAILPTAIEAHTHRRLCAERLSLVISNDAHHLQQWEESILLRGVLPVGAYAAEVLADITALVTEAVDFAHDWNITSLLPTQIPIRADLSVDVALAGTIPVVVTQNNHIARISFTKNFNIEKVHAALDLLCLAASGHIYEGAVVIMHDAPKNRMMPRFVAWAEPLTPDIALRKLASIAELVHSATQVPAVRFGKTADAMSDTIPNENKARDQFLSYLYSDQYPSSVESLLFGSTPQFTDVFSNTSPITKFWVNRARAFTDPQHQKTGAKRKSPVNKKSVESYLTS
jgi:exodeoxyribonuclease V gamma subunit